MSTPTRKVAFHTLGCKLNFAETSTLSRDLISHGYERVDFRESADVCVINTCTVTHNADRECGKIIRQARRRSPNATIVVTGCYAQLKPETIADMEGVDLILGTEEKFNLPEYLATLETNGHTQIHRSEIENSHHFMPSFSMGERTRSFLKVQDGCDYTCTYCTIPMARGQNRSSTVTRTIDEARIIAKTGMREIVLTGVNIGDFGKGTGETFLDLIKELDSVQGIDRFRISSIEPNLLSDEIIQFVAGSEKFVPHFHIPLQSGSNRILKLMQRRYGIELYEDRVGTIRSLLPHSCIGVDIIVGFPSESDADFNQTVTFLQEMDMSYLHVFTYSERDHTKALEITNPVPIQKRAERSRILHNLSEKKRHTFHDQFLNREYPVLFEMDRNGILEGHTENYIRVQVPGGTDLINEILSVHLTRNRGSYMEGEISRG